MKKQSTDSDSDPFGGSTLCPWLQRVPAFRRSQDIANLLLFIGGVTLST